MCEARPVAALQPASRYCSIATCEQGLAVLTQVLELLTVCAETWAAWAGGQHLGRDLGSGNSETRPSSQPSSQQGSKNKGSGESFDPKTAFVVDLPKSDVCTHPISLFVM